MEFESLSVQFTHILGLPCLLEVPLQCQQFRVLTLVIRQDGNPIFQLIEIGERRIIHKYDLRKIPSQDPQVLCIELAVQFHAVLAI